ncbi:DUF6531 domain-containing protein [Streptomyces sp. NPDC004134]|uniref:DUF6531 domain-containing protein n=1 Tax=Streptomyces sp. NPDC004134 TaxID=3364691 RepID=UPI0036C1C13E
MLTRAWHLRVVAAFAAFAALLLTDVLRAGPFAAEGEPLTVPAGVVAKRTSQPLKPAKAMTREERRTQIQRAELLEGFQHGAKYMADRYKPIKRVRPPTVTRSEGSKETFPPPSSGVGMLREGVLSGSGTGPRAADDDDNTDRIWGSIYNGWPEQPYPDEEYPFAVDAPSNVALWFNGRPGRTTWSVDANWTGEARFPYFIRIQLYRASDNALVATRITNFATLRRKDTSGGCLQWIGQGGDQLCSWSVTDGVIAGTAGTDYYAKLSYANEIGSYYEQLDADSWQHYETPTGWTTAVRTPTAPALRTPGVPGSMAGACTCPYQVYRADPVNTATGAVTESATDASVPGSGLPLSLTRNYSSLAKNGDGLLGKGWRLSFESKLTATADAVTLTDTDGAVARFTPNGDGTYTAPKPARYKLTPTADGHTLTNIDQTKRVYDTSGRLVKWLDGSGKGLTLGYANGTLDTVTDAVGRQHTLDVDAATGRLTSVTLADARTVDYRYEGEQLASVTSVDGAVWRYGYDTGGRLASITDPGGTLVTQNTYDATTGRIATQVDAHGGEYTFSWEPDPDLPAGSGESTMVDPDGGRWTDVYETGVLIRGFRPAGGYTSRYFDQHLNPETEYDDKVQPTQRTFDARGNVATQTKGGVTEEFDFDASDRLTSYTNGRGKTTTISYDGTSDRPLEVSGPEGTTTYTYTDGQVESITEPGDRTTDYAYNNQGLPVSQTTPAGRKTTYTYDAAGRIKTTTNPRGNETGADPAKYTTTNEYNAAGRLATVTDPQGNTTAYTYDFNGNTKTVTDALDRVTSYDYNAANQVTKITGPDGSVTTTEYDKRGNMTSAVDAEGNRTSYTYDAVGRMASSTTPRGNLEGADPAQFTTTYGYDDNGNLTESVDPTGALTTTDYDELDRPVKITDPMERVTETRYDAAGNVTQEILPHGKGPTYTYTDDNLLKTVTNANGETTSYGYTTARQKASESSPLGHQRTWSYTPDGQMRTEVDPRGHAEGADPAQFTTTYDYDATGNLTEVRDPLGGTTSYTLDVLNRQTVVVDPNGKSTTTDYDALGRIKSVSAPDSGVTRYTYDTAGNTATRVDANEQTTTYGYDKIGQLTSATDPLNRTTSYKYDPDGNRNEVTNARGTTTTISHDALGRPTVTDYSDATPDVTVGYDATGNRLQVKDGSGTRTFTYNPLQQLKTVSVPGLSSGFTYGYNGVGQLVKRTPPSGNTTTYTYDANGNQDTATTAGATTTYRYDAAANLTASQLPTANGYTEQRDYDAAGRLTDIASTKANVTLSGWHATLDPAGQPHRITSTRKSTTAHSYYTYDDAGRLLTECTSPTEGETCPTGAPTTSYTYDKVGNRKTRTAPDGAITNYTYDTADQLTEATTGSSTTSYAYDADGNQTQVGARTYAYDAENRLTSMTAAGSTWGFQYDADGNRVKRTRGNVTLAWDINNTLPQLAAEYTSTGALNAEYTYNPLEQIESQHRTISGTNTAYYYHRDLTGSVTDLTTETGGHAKTYNYTSAFGTGGPAAGAEQPSNNFGYTGQYKEPVSGEDPSLADALGYNLRARTYTPATGRFTSPDPLTMPQGTPAESAYAYAGNAPNHRLDPAGTCWWGNSNTNCWSNTARGIRGSSLNPSGIFVRAGRQLMTLSNDCLFSAVTQVDREYGESRFLLAARFMYGEMKKNINSQDVKLLRQMLGKEGPLSWFGWTKINKAYGPAGIMWWGLVKSGGPWDHKGILRAMFSNDSDLNFQVPGENLSAYFDIWSNYHYGYVGMHAGFGRWALEYGAVEAPGAGRTDVGDRMTVSAGIGMYEKYGSGMTAGQFYAEVIANIKAMAREGAPQVEKF